MPASKILLKFAICFCLLCKANQGFAQQKFEREFSVKISDVPAAAKDFIRSLNTGSRINWFMEEGFEKKSFEAKFRWNKKHFSIEFDTAGVLEDVEIEVKAKQIDTKVWAAIQKHLHNDFEKSSVQKVQIQYTGKANDVLVFLSENKLHKGITIKYELEVIGTSNRRKKLYEYLFSDKGEFIERREVMIRNTDNLEY